MARSLACADLGMAGCPGSFTVETDEELWQHVDLHAKAAHPELEMTPELLEQAKGLVRTA